MKIEGVVAQLSPDREYKALFDATKAPAAAGELNPVLKRIGVQLNAMAARKVPLSKVDFRVIFHGPATDAILTNDKFRAKHGMANPNLALVARLQKAGVRFLVCGQFMAHKNIARSDLLPNIEIAEAATMVMIQSANNGYAIITD